MKKLTTEEFIARAQMIHNFKYTYEKFNYSFSREKGIVHCPAHDADFLVSPNQHLRGVGCKKCGNERTGLAQSKSKEEYLKDFKEAHGDKYDYSESVFNKAKDKIKIICKSHRPFWQTPDKHKKQGCPDCSLIQSGLQRREDFEGFVDKARKVHGDKYDYISVDFNEKSYVTAICYDHGIFEQLTSSHLVGAGCSGCARTGFDRGKKAELYILTLDNITKIGITNLSAQERCNRISKSKGKQFNIHKVFNCDSGSVVDDLETVLLRKLRSVYKQPTDKFEGHSECFLDVDVEQLIEYIQLELGVQSEC